MPDAAGSAAGGDEPLGQLGEGEALGAGDLQDLALERPVVDGQSGHGGDVNAHTRRVVSSAATTPVEEARS